MAGFGVDGAGVVKNIGPIPVRTVCARLHLDQASFHAGTRSGSRLGGVDTGSRSGIGSRIGFRTGTGLMTGSTLMILRFSPIWLMLALRCMDNQLRDMGLRMRQRVALLRRLGSVSRYGLSPLD
jgi:hypothetical protein